MTTEEILKELKGYGDEGTKNIYLKHGAKEPYYGVKVQDLKKIQKREKKQHELSMELFATGNSDAMYLAGLIADENKISKSDLNKWVKEAYWYMISEYTVAWIAAESKYGMELGLEWIESEKEGIASAGWSTLSNLVSIKPDSDLDIKIFEGLLDRVGRDIYNSQNRVRYTMNGFVIAAGTFISSLTDTATAVAEQIGKIKVDMGGTACKVPYAPDYIQKIKDKDRIGKKRKMARC